jgi:hypothetical protein
MSSYAYAPKPEGDGPEQTIFVHSELDEYGLTPIEFRVYGRLARRCCGSERAAYQSVPNMARDFGVNDRTVQRTLKLLVMAGLISAKLRPGDTTIYTLQPRSAWLPPKQLQTFRERIAPPKKSKRLQVVTSEPGVGGDIRAGGGVTSEPGGVVTSEPDKDTPSEDTPLKVLPHTTPRASATPSPRSAVAGVGVESSKSRFSFEHRKLYATKYGLGGGWLTNSQDGRYDEMIADALAAQRPEAVERSLIEPPREQMPLRLALQHVGSILKKYPNASVADELDRLDVSEETRARVLAHDFPQKRAAAAQPRGPRRLDLGSVADMGAA